MRTCSKSGLLFCRIVREENTGGGFMRRDCYSFRCSDGRVKKIFEKIKFCHTNATIQEIYLW